MLSKLIRVFLLVVDIDEVDDNPLIFLSILVV